MSDLKTDYKDFSGLIDEEIEKLPKASAYFRKGAGSRWSATSQSIQGAYRFSVLPGTESFVLEDSVESISIVELRDYEGATFSKIALANQVFNTYGNLFTAYENSHGGRQSFSPYIYSHPDFIDLAMRIQMTSRQNSPATILNKLGFKQSQDVWYHVDQMPITLDKTLLIARDKLTLYLVPSQNTVGFAIYRNGTFMGIFDSHLDAVDLFNKLWFSDIDLMD